MSKADKIRVQKANKKLEQQIEGNSLFPPSITESNRRFQTKINQQAES
jgi:hypothetical protein